MKGNIYKANKALLFCLLLSSPFILKAKPLVFNILDYKAKGDGVTLNTKSIQAAIDACSKSGGGTVLFPAGRFVSGTIYLKSHVSLFLEAGAVLEGSKNLKDYPVTISKVRSYTDNYTNKSLIYAEDVENISITGSGLIDGNGAWFKVENMENSDELRKQDDYAFYKYRPYLIRIINCRNILVRDITLINSPMWVQHYLQCEDINIDGIKVNSRVNHNNDGIDIDGCRRVRISNCDIISGDDAIVLKSTLNVPCMDITITNCTLSSHCNAFKLGTETNGGFQNIVFSNCTIYDTGLAGITLQIVDGGTMERVSVSNVTMTNVATAVFIRLGNRARPYNDTLPKPGMGRLSDIIIDNIIGKNIGKTGCSIVGIPGYKTDQITHGMHGVLPAYGFYCRHVKNLSLSNVSLGFENKDLRPALVFDDAENIQLTGIKANINIGAPVMKFSRVKNAIMMKNKYKDVNMAGLSGGGWTTNLLAAIDERIKYSFSVAGSMPVYYRSRGSMRDVEQFLPEFYRDIAGYPELYVLGAFGKGRKQVQVLNRNDDCCFCPKQHDPGRSYDSDLRTFEASVKKRLGALGANDQYYLIIDETAPNHQISAATLNNVILKELNSISK